MPTMSFAHVLIFSDGRRFVLHKQYQECQLFIHSCTVKESENGIIEYWKCVHRFCSVRLCSAGTFFEQLPDSAKHTHSPDHSTSTFLRKNQYFLEKILVQSKIRSRTLISNGESPNNNGTVLKQLLLTGKDEESSFIANRESSQGAHMDWASSCVQINPTLSPISLEKSKLTSPSFRSNFPSGYSHYRLDPLTNSWIPHPDYQREHWSPPILTPPLDGSYSPLPTPFARIEPYVEPQVMYNPYFLWQLCSYKESCNNNSVNGIHAP